MSLSADSIKALKYLIKQTPSGEIQDVIPHLFTISGDQESVKQSPDILLALKKWYEAHKYHVPLPNSKSAMVSEAGFVGESDSDFSYYDGTLGITFKFDPFTLVSEIVSEQPREMPTNQLREEIAGEIQKYVGVAYRDGKALY